MKKKRSQAPAIGPRLQAERQKQHLSLQELAARSGVSKSLLSQIERGEANPTFATLWHLTRALELEFSDLISMQSKVGRGMIETIPANLIPEIRTEDGLCILRILGPTHTVGTMEWYDLTVAPRGALVSRPHAKGATEHLSVRDGVLKISSGDEEQMLSAGMTGRYAADVPHAIRNAGKKPARALLVVISKP
ncbi:MAG TPA: XRE family transcriptional regulator [Rhizomicrobium sp.]|jgi:transcriptional regulator with XRE-family HTH domain